MDKHKLETSSLFTQEMVYGRCYYFLWTSFLYINCQRTGIIYSGTRTRRSTNLCDALTSRNYTSLIGLNVKGNGSGDGGMEDLSEALTDNIIL